MTVPFFLCIAAEDFSDFTADFKDGVTVAAYAYGAVRAFYTDFVTVFVLSGFYCSKGNGNKRGKGRAGTACAVFVEIKFVCVTVGFLRKTKVGLLTVKRIAGKEISEVIYIKLISAPGKMNSVNARKPYGSNGKYPVADFCFSVYCICKCLTGRAVKIIKKRGKHPSFL